MRSRPCFRFGARSAMSLAILGIGLAASMSASAARDCTAATLRGGYGATSTGTVLGAGPVGGISRIVFDGEGGFEIRGTANGNRKVARDYRARGSYELRRDCSGLLRYDAGSALPEGMPLQSRFVVSGDASELRIVGIDSRTVVQTHARKQFRGKRDRQCSVADLHGRFAATGSGTVDGAGVLAAVGTIEFDGEGAFRVARVINLNGRVFENDVATGTYTVNEDCTGEVAYGSTDSVKMGPISHNDFVIAADGAELRVMSTDVGRVLFVVASK